MRERGPLWVIYPWSQHPELDDRIHRQRSIWQLTAIEVDMSTGGRARLIGAALLIVAILVFAASLLLIERRLQRLTRNATDGATEVQLERVPGALRARAPAAQPRPRGGDAAATRLRCARASTCSGAGSRRCAPAATRDPFVSWPAPRSCWTACRRRCSATPARSSARRTRPRSQALSRDLAADQDDLQRLMLELLQRSAESHSRLQQNLRELRPIGWLSLGGLLTSAGILMFLLWREIRHTRRLLARTEESRDRIQHLAHHDALTGLPNRRLFEDRLIQALAVAARARRRLALLYLDLDGFKEINDSLGHRAGDELLRVVAERLATSVRGGDTIARLGGDEFAVIQIELRTATDAAILAERLMAAAAKPIRVGQQDLVIGASVGIALYPDDGGTADELRANADVALYSAKAAGRARMAYYRPELTTEARTRGLLRRDLARGIEEGELELHYQPKVAAADGSVTGLEALLRWHHPQRGTLAPGAFLPLAEETGLIEPLGAWVMADALGQIGRWRAGGIAPPRVAINLSPSQLRRGGIARRLADLIQAADIPPGADRARAHRARAARRRPPRPP